MTFLFLLILIFFILIRSFQRLKDLNIFFLSIVNTTIVSLVAATLISLGIYF